MNVLRPFQSIDRLCQQPPQRWNVGC